jgi:hypothetical protein
VPAQAPLPRHAAHARPVPAWLLVWLAAGIALLACMPSLRASTAAGASGPFWLVGAPLLDLAWLRRARIAKALAAGSGVLGARLATRRRRRAR